jgi:excisionase family DNA binding protein
MTENMLFNIKFYTLQEAAEILGVTLTTMRSYATKGLIPARKVGGKWLISEEVLKEHVAGESDRIIKGKLIPFGTNQSDVSKFSKTLRFPQKNHNHGCCYSSEIPVEEMDHLLYMLTFLKLTNSSYKDHFEKLKFQTVSLIDALNERYNRIRISIFSPKDSIYYGFLSRGMDKHFSEEFDSLQVHPLKKKIYKIDYNEISKNCSLNFLGHDTLKILCNEQIETYYNRKGINRPNYFQNIGLGKQINHEITIKLDNPFSSLHLILSLDHGSKREFYYEELLLLQSIISDYGYKLGVSLFLSVKELVENKLIEEEIDDYLGVFDRTYKSEDKDSYIKSENTQQPEHNGKTVKFSDIEKLLAKVKEIDFS